VLDPPTLTDSQAISPNQHTVASKSPSTLAVGHSPSGRRDRRRCRRGCRGRQPIPARRRPRPRAVR
jgi:hypothetical protein